ncbi:S8 family serine peptidase [Candidatus Nomurabacteria bacterium]|nr:S8 family serine peptidase [Candidatus Nomurabacteria bacterium]MCB9803634.1 S8 family serine peptidase [Candidatus Nomurabacteria bacterium]
MLSDLRKYTTTLLVWVAVPIAFFITTYLVEDDPELFFGVTTERSIEPSLDYDTFTFIPEDGANAMYLVGDQLSSMMISMSQGDIEVISKFGVQPSVIGDSPVNKSSENILIGPDIDKITLYRPEGTPMPEINFMKSGLLAMSLEGMDQGLVLGASDNKGYSDTKFLTENGVQVIARDVWIGGEVSEPAEIQDIKGIDIFPMPRIGEARSVDRVRTLYDMQSNKCRYTEGYAPVACAIDETWGDIAYNYILTEDAVLYEGRTGGNGVTGLQNVGTGDRISIVVEVSDNYAELIGDVLIGTLKVLADVNSLSNDRIEFHNVMDSSSFNDLTNDVETQLNALRGDFDEIIDDPINGKEVLKINGEVQLIVTGESAVLGNVLEKAGAEVFDSNNDSKIDTALVDQSIANQVIQEINTIEGKSVIQPNYIYRLRSWNNTDPTRAVPSDYDPTVHWNFQKVMLPEVWSDLGGCISDNSCGGDPSVIVAVIDTGVAYEDFDYDAGGSYSIEYVGSDPIYPQEIPATSTPNSIFNEGYDRVYRANPELSNVNFVSPYDSWQDYVCNTLRQVVGATPCNATEITKIDHANDDHGHGTFVTGIIAADTSDASPNRVVGIAHNVSIMPIKVFSQNDTSLCETPSGLPDPTCSYPLYDSRVIALTTTIIDAINYAVSNGAKILNMSLGGQGQDFGVETAITNAKNAGVLTIVAAGNENDDASLYFPANAPDAFVVGATDNLNNRAEYSNYGSVIDIVAPAGDTTGAGASSIRYTCSGTTPNTCSDETNPNLFQSFSSTSSPGTGYGTSFAAPQVAAAAALLWSDTPTASVDEISAALRNSAIDLGDAGFDIQFGYGLLDIEAALGREQNVEDPPVEPPPPPVETTYTKYFTWYDTKYSDRLAWILIGNPSTTSSLTANIKIGSVVNSNYTVPAGGKVTPSWTGIQTGPVEISSSKDFYASQRVSFSGSFNEFAAIDSASLTNKYYFTWYDTSRSNRQAWILIGNPSTTQTASVNVKIGNQINQNYTIPAGGRITPSFTGIKNGPVVVTSNINVYTTQRVNYENSFNEYAGIPSSSLTNKYYFTWYDTIRSNRLAWILIGNPSSSQSAYVNVKIGNSVNQNFSIPPGGKVTPEWNGIQNGPVVVTSDINVYTTQRVSYEGSFNEYPGIASNTLSKQFYFTWYDTSRPDRLAWILIGNPSTTTTATVNIKIGNVVNQSYSIPPGGRITPAYPNIKDGPVVITSNVNVYTTQRVSYQGSFNEYAGIVQ